MTVGLYAMQKIFLRFHHIPYEDLAKMVLANKKKSGLLHFEELEKMAQEIAEELLMWEAGPPDLTMEKNSENCSVI